MTGKDCPGHADERSRRFSSASKCFAISALALTCGLVAGVPESQAAEYGFTTYPLGSQAFGAGITPPPGTYVTDSISYFTGSIGGNIDIGGVLFNAGAKVEFFSEGVSILMVPETKILDGNLGLLVSVPVSHMNLEAARPAPGATLSATRPNSGALAIRCFKCNSAGIQPISPTPSMFWASSQLGTTSRASIP